jgi:hypothetical protein
MRRALLVASLVAVPWLANPAGAQEKFIGSNVDLRTILTFKASDAAVQKRLPEGWEVNSPQAGPAKGFNLVVVLVDQVLSQDADGKPVATWRGAGLGIPAKKKGTDIAGTMVIGGLVEQAGSPGAYGVYAAAQMAIDRKRQTGGENTSRIEESWQIRTEDGDSIEVQIQFSPGVPTRAKFDAKMFSAAKPEFFRIYRVEHATDVVRSTATGVDRVTKLSFKAAGDKLSPLFDGTEQLISITSIPWYSRQLYLPGS